MRIRSSAPPPGWSTRARALPHDVAGPVAAGGILVGLLATGWSGLWQDSPSGRLALVATLAFVPAIVRVVAGRRAMLWSALSAVAAALVVLGAAVGSTPVELVSGNGGTWGRLGDIIPEGLGKASATPLPLAAERAPALSSLLILVLAAAAALIAWQAIVARRPLAGVIATATGLAYRWTLVPPERVITTGLVTLIVALIAFRLGGPQRPRNLTAPARAVLAGAIVVSVAVLGSVGADRAPASWWNWRAWTFGTGTGPTSLDLSQRYGSLDWPEQPSVLARVEADEPIPLRLQALETFDGNSWVYSAAPIGEDRVNGSIDLRPDLIGEPRAVSQKITIENARTPWLPAGGRPAQVRGIGRRTVLLLNDGAVRVRPALAPDTTYDVDTYLPDPTPAQLVQSPAYTDVGRKYLEIVLGGRDEVVVPVWGQGERLDADAFGAYSGVYRLSREVIGDASTAFEAANKVEAFLRDTSKFEYDETTTRPPQGQPDLVEFLTGRRRGYCQHFAGSMALMLRMNGIPTRVVVGLTSNAGRFDPDKSTYEILDRDAHSWVEVEFPGYGWIPFDPTPGRSVPSRASVSSPTYVGDEEIQSQTPVDIAPAPVAPTARPDALRNEPPDAPATPAAGDGPSRLWLLAIPGVLIAALLTPAVLKAVRRRRRRHGDERARVLGATRELESFAQDLGAAVHPAMSPSERADALWRDLGLQVGPLYTMATSARFGPDEPEAGSGARAWEHLSRARRTLDWKRRLRASLRLRSLRTE
jgi:transglutaminase-like putative cysteine protease